MWMERFLPHFPRALCGGYDGVGDGTLWTGNVVRNEDEDEGEESLSCRETLKRDEENLMKNLQLRTHTMLGIMCFVIKVNIS